MADIEIEKLLNGYELEYTDPEIAKANQSPSGKLGRVEPYRDPRVAMAFKTAKELGDFIGKNLDSICKNDSYGSAFSQALADKSED